MLSRVTAKNVGDVFFETHCRLAFYRCSHFLSGPTLECLQSKIFFHHKFRKRLCITNNN